MTRWLSCCGEGGPLCPEGLATTGCCTECGCSASVVGFVVLWLVVALCDHHVCFHDRGFSLYVCMYDDESACGVLSLSPVCASSRVLLPFFLGVQDVSIVCRNVSLRLVFGVRFCVCG